MRKGVVDNTKVERLLDTLGGDKHAVRQIVRKLNDSTLNSRPIPAEIGNKVDELYDKYIVRGLDETAGSLRRLMIHLKDILDAVDSERKEQILMGLWLVILLSRKSDVNSERRAATLNESAANPLKKPSEMSWYTILADEPLHGDHWVEDDYAQSDNLSEWSESEKDDY
ncbi:hypothetical protein E3Q22_01374 [Wallemia mellicola]|uniref:Uncharacterized protein n=2 Tax=Wallemia mellicola TaxID=1708541 RepID=A0A4T0RB37_9BASI|nr:hypothetical protein WALSEDRAFT_60142 [Wallemia mellicola CBS 633.66]TIB70732.1 hypothetical protein E3Q24_02780 [Wallemia mellicola]EIM22039.1 hypothetical protein WALSEDRAFT_60142 [Wallemia mellicola CBS 633.66]TIB79232.1 hypothetical protein E3Q23_00347 [Wallemia mellicola]TIB81147.1 hypothetical protein E3Q22_01374 [Wallemia mellicola]TIB87381.1 hypothetical protein E3Q21_01360 [Wallemia mellicola]|eukprot:XP_006957844.1 hypothetical protein WALSEDRAFT_60142 [Wallemia mellicola CBS 633.66]